MSGTSMAAIVPITTVNAETSSGKMLTYISNTCAVEKLSFKKLIDCTENNGYFYVHSYA